MRRADIRGADDDPPDVIAEPVEVAEDDIEAERQVSRDVLEDGELRT